MAFLAVAFLLQGLRLWANFIIHCQMNDYCSRNSSLILKTPVNSVYQHLSYSNRPAKSRLPVTKELNLAKFSRTI